jgi:capsular exopolysaccharide synthesis family protein
MTDPAPVAAESPEDERGARARQIAGVISRRALIIGSCAVLIPLAVFILVSAQPRQDRAEVLIQPGPLIPSEVLVSSQVPSGWFSSPNGSFVALLAKTPPVRIEAGRLLNRPAAELGSVQATPHKKTGWVTIAVTSDSPREAISAANAFASATGQNLRLRTKRAVATLTSSLENQFATEKNPAIRAGIREQLGAFRAFRPSDAEPIQVIAPAVDSAPVSNNPALAAAIALLIALFIGWRLAQLAERADDRIHDPEEVEEVVGASLLTAIPEGLSGPEPFLRLRDSLIHLGGAGERATLVVASPGKGDGRTSVAIGLAKAYTAAGRDVVLVDSDLRDPQLATQLVVAPIPGVADVLAGERLDGALHGGLHPGLTVLPAGQPGPVTADLVGSGRMAPLLEQLEARFDVVIIDTPPLFEASDALALVHAATGVLLVARVGHTTVRALKGARQILTRAGARILGPVATGVDADHRMLPLPLADPPDRNPVAQAAGG